MRVLLLFRGAPGCGKSTFIDNNGLRPYALSADEIRLQCESPQQNIYGKDEISCKNDKLVWKTLFKLLETRMSKGEFTVIDATNSKSSEMNRYKELADTYRYRIFCIDFTDLPIEECKARNASRPELKQVPETAIDKMYARFANQKIPSGIKVIKPNELDSIFIKKFDMSNYEKIVHIGDIHGSYTALMEYFKDGLNDNYMYIFCGDYIDRGIENVEVIKFLLEIYKKPNVLLLEGNHERWLWVYANNAPAGSKEFELVTKPQLKNSDISTKDLRQLYRKLGQCAWYTYGDKEVLVTHGGVATLPKNLGYLATEQMIKGVGNYNDYSTIAETWLNTTDDNMYQIFGHRNTRHDGVQLNDRVFNLEGQVEFGGHLRVVELDKNGFHTIEIKNDVFRTIEEFEETKQLNNSSVADIVMNMRNNKFIMEKQFGNISSFNFTKDAFYDKVWNEQTVVARGLYINTNTMKIVTRGYDKYFKIGERPETKLDILQHKLQFPVTCYVKENGYLGLVSYNEETDDLFVTTKSTPDGDYAMWLREMIDSKMSEGKKQEMKAICKEHNVTFAFECVDIKRDPHIIEYPENELFLLAIIRNDINFSQFSYEELVNIGNTLGLKVKTKAFEISNWSDFYDWYYEVTAEDYEYDGHHIEGFVIEDAVGYMVKIKGYFYNHWKHMRGIAHSTLRNGYIRNTSSLTDTESNNFYAFCQKLYNEHTKEEREQIPKDIIYLRNLFYKQ